MTFALIKDTKEDISPVLLTGVRFAVTATLMWPILLGVKANRRAWKDSVWLGVLLSGCYITQAHGLGLTTASTSAFVTSTCTLMVPLADFAMRGRKPRAVT